MRNGERETMRKRLEDKGKVKKVLAKRGRGERRRRRVGKSRWNDGHREERRERRKGQER